MCYLGRNVVATVLGSDIIAFLFRLWCYSFWGEHVNPQFDVTFILWLIVHICNANVVSLNVMGRSLEVFFVGSLNEIAQIKTVAGSVS